MQELVHLASRLEVSREQLEERVGKKLDELNRPEAKEWVKRLRAMADELAPSARSRYGRWPEAQEDREAAYLSEQQEAGASFAFKLFNGEIVEGSIVDFTPYTITIRSSASGEAADEVVLRKLAIAYYRKLPDGKESNGEPARTHDHARDDARQPLDDGMTTDRVGDPDVPERDRMDKDRGM
jgi:hypothetical protein